MDLDRFRYVNDTLGHPIGDLLLREVAARLQAVVQRATDTVARLGGDEFAILLPNASVADAQRVAEAILRVLEAPMTLEGHVVDIHASIGLVHLPRCTGTSRRKLLRCADVAMYEAKRSNRGIAVWDDRYYQHSVERLSLMSDLRKAVDNDELALVYQPKISFGSRRSSTMSRHSFAGSIRRAGSSRRRNSFRSPNRPATSARSRSG